jgi:hypothetical protein
MTKDKQSSDRKKNFNYLSLPSETFVTTKTLLSPQMEDAIGKEHR